MSCQCLLRGGNMDKLQECFPTMHLSSALSDCSDDSNKSIGIPPSFSCDGNQTEGILKWELMNDDLKSSIEELNSELDRNHQTLDDKIKELDDAVDELESVHKNTIMVSLVGSSVGAAGGIAAIAGACFAPFTLGASLALTGVGAVAGVAGGVTSGASNFTNKVRQKTLREKIENIISELQNTIKPMLKLLRKIDNITEDIKLVEQTLKKQKKKERSARDGSDDVVKIVGVADLAILGKLCAEAAKEIRVYVKAVKAVRGPASAARAVRATAETTTFFRTASAFAGVLSAVFLALDVYYIVKDSVELSEMNQPADKRKEEISSETLKYILQTKAAADQFKKTVGKIKDAVDSAVP